MKILLLNQAFWPDVVASAQQLTMLARRLSERGHQVTVITSARGYDDATTSFPRGERWHSIDIVRISSVGAGKKHRWQRTLNFASFLFACAARLIAMPRQDVVIALTSPPLISWLGSLFIRIKGGELIFWPLDLNPDEAIAAGWTHFKMKVGRDLEANRRRAALMRDAIGNDRVLMMDANQCWGVDEAIEQIRSLAEFDPWWIEEPTSPDDVLGHAKIAKAIAPIGVATGEACQNRVIFKQLFQANAIRFCQVDTCRLASVNEWLVVVLMAAKFAVPVCPHAGGVGLCELAQHVSIFDYICASGTMDGRVLEYVDHLHEHFIEPVRMRGNRYLVPEAPGYSITMKGQSLADYEFPTGRTWR